MLESLGSKAVGPLPLPDRWQESTAAATGYGLIRDFVAEAAQGDGLRGWKDPRICLFLPLWNRAFVELNAEVRYIVSVRDPVHVANSLQTRYRLEDNGVFQLMWHHYMLSALSGTRGSKRAFVSYQDLVRDWRSAIARAVERADLPLNTDVPLSVARQIDGFLDPALQRSTAGSRVELAAGFVEESYQILQRAWRDEPAIGDDERVEKLLRDYETYSRAFGPYLKELEDRIARLYEAHSSAFEVQEAVARSASWRITWPLRKAKELFANAPPAPADSLGKVRGR
jgi:hypothetical protein